MLISIDIGNSSTGIGVFVRERLVTLRLDTHPVRNAGEYADAIAGLLNQNHIQNHVEKEDVRCIISSVVPTHTGAVLEAVNLLAGHVVDTLLVSNRLETGLCLRISAPETLGADRLTNASGAFALYKRAVAVVDYGTATTVTMVNADANLIGGAIIPGLRLMTAALGSMTSQLKEVSLEQPGSALGRDTEAAIRSGIFFGTAGAVERIIAEAEGETGVHFLPVITGGHCTTMLQYMTRPCEKRPDLIYQGLRIIYEKNRT